MLRNVIGHVAGKRKQLLEDFLLLRFGHFLLSEQESNHRAHVLRSHAGILRMLIVLDLQKLIHSANTRQPRARGGKR